jgi:FKBP-type peptidyl-prolyl cis-trans isomerase FkpA
MLRKFITFSLLLVIAVSCKKDVVTDYGPIDKKIIEDYLAAHSLTAQSTASGLYYIIERPGGSVHPTINSSVTAHYRGYLTTGEVFDQTYSTGKPADFQLKSVVKGWQEGMQLIGINGKIKLFVPSTLGYGATAQGSIPANSVLIFDVELIDIYL